MSRREIGDRKEISDGCGEMGSGEGEGTEQ